VATIEESIILHDGMSPVLQKMVNQIDSTNNGLAEMRKQAQQAAESGNIIKKSFGSAFNALSNVSNPAKALSLDISMNPALSDIANQVKGATSSLSEMEMQAHRTAEGGEMINSAYGSASNTIKSGFKSAAGTFALGNIAASMAMQAAEYISQIPGKIMRASDEYAGMQARLQMVAGSAEQAAEMNNRIFESAMRARGSYEGMLSNVSKIAMTAKEAFPDPKQVVPFVEEVQKLFAIGGTGIEEQKNAMLQLTQALGSGRLQGDEFRSIAEAAPMIEQMIAKEMGVTQGELKQLGSQGLITADVIKNAIFNNMDEINAKFAQIPMTFESMGQQMSNVLQRAMAPAFQAISQAMNSEGMREFASSMAEGIMIVGTALAWVISGTTNLISAIADAGSYGMEWIDAIITALGALSPIIAVLAGLYAGMWLAANGGAMLHSVWCDIVRSKEILAKGATLLWSGATKSMAVAQWMLNTALAMNPIGIVITLVGLAIGAFAAWRIGTIGLKNTVAEAFGAIANIVETTVNIMIDAVNGLIKVLNKAAGGINSVFGTHIGTIAEVEHVSGWGKGVENFIQNFSVSDLIPTIDIPTGGGGAGEYIPDDTGAIGDIADYGGQTADNTARMADEIDAMDEDLKYLRDVAEREAIDQYTTASVTIELGGVTNNVNNEMDVDGIVDKLTDGIQRGMVAAAQEVHP
jgi:tape measure domain-containing protein